jgi:hypothetical protein
MSQRRRLAKYVRQLFRPFLLSRMYSPESEALLANKMTGLGMAYAEKLWFGQSASFEPT